MTTELTLESRVQELERTVEKLVVAVENLYNTLMDQPVHIQEGKEQWDQLWGSIPSGKEIPSSSSESVS